MARRNRFIAIAVTVLAVAVLLLALVPGVLAQQFIGSKTVAAGTTWVVDQTTRMNVLVVELGATVKAADGSILTLTVNGVETGQALITTIAMDTAIKPGTYMGDVVLTPAASNLVAYAAPGPPGPPIMFPFRQAVYVGAGGMVPEKSVPAAVKAGQVTSLFARNLELYSTGEAFTGVYVAGGSYTLTNPRISFVGNGRSDFIGLGTGIVATGGSRVVVDGADILNKGVARAAVIADGGANLLVKNSRLVTQNGVLPVDYVPTIDTSQMRSVPWMLGLSGNVRCTNLLGTNTKATYVNSYIASEGWGVMSTDGCTTPTLTAINDTIAVTGEDGYGSYGIGDATEYFLGCTMDVATYATISRGSFLHYGDSDKATVAGLNQSLGIGLTEAELAALPVRNTIVNSRRNGIMWHGGGTLDITGGTVFNTKETVFVDKAQVIKVTVDGSKGAQLNAGNGVLFQLMDDDDPGPVFPAMTNTGVYSDPTGQAKPDITHVIYSANPEADAVATFSNITLMGDFYNSTRGGIMQGPFGPPASVSRNLVLTFENAKVTGTITASNAVHKQATIGAADYKQIGAITNTATAPVNNGVLVNLTKGSTWVVTGTSYLSRLDLAPGSTIAAPAGFSVSLTLGGKPMLFKAGSYIGQVVLTVKPLSVFGGTSLKPMTLPATN
jgi:hypothetical protein